MPVVHSIGVRRKALETFMTLLQEAGIDAIIDIRLRNTSQLLGYSKRDDFAFLLRNGFGIAYEHRPVLAPTPEILDTYRDDGDWQAYERQFVPLMHDREMEAVGEVVVSRYRRPCLLCSEIKPDRCHRRLVAEYWHAHIPNLEIVHL